MGLTSIPMRAETGLGGDLSHEFIILAETGESGVFCDKAILDLRPPGDDVDYNSDLSPLIEPWLKPYAATEDVHDAARFEREVPAERRLHTRGIEVGQVFYFGTNIPTEPDASPARGAEHSGHRGSYGVGVRARCGGHEAVTKTKREYLPDSVAPSRW